jgi:hypothetical protein
VWRRRWKWVEDSERSRAFASWRGALPEAQRVELEAGLAVLLDYGPEHDTYRINKDLYVVYACCRLTVLWLLVGDASPGTRQLLPLDWGIREPSKRRLADAAKKAGVLLAQWRADNPPRR